MAKAAIMAQNPVTPHRMGLSVSVHVAVLVIPSPSCLDHDTQICVNPEDTLSQVTKGRSFHPLYVCLYHFPFVFMFLHYFESSRRDLHV
jgi:hypothetical protein